VKSVLQPRLLEAAVESGLRSLFVGFETISEANLRDHRKHQNLNKDYAAAIRRLHDLGVMVNASFVFGMDHEDVTVFDRTVEWAVSQGVETATFHILTPYPSTGLYQRIGAQGRLLHRDWDRYDTRHTVFRPARMSPSQLEDGYWAAYRDFYRWRNIAHGAATKPDWTGRARHFAYAAGWKKFERVWDTLIRARQVTHALPVLEGVLSGLGRINGRQPSNDEAPVGDAPRPSVLTQRASNNPCGCSAPEAPGSSSSVAMVVHRPTRAGRPSRVGPPDAIAEGRQIVAGDDLIRGADDSRVETVHSQG